VERGLHVVAERLVRLVADRFRDGGRVHDRGHPGERGGDHLAVPEVAVLPVVCPHVETDRA
jgi:hypothetical protein